MTTTCNSCGAELHEGDATLTACPICGGEIHTPIKPQVHSEELDTTY